MKRIFTREEFEKLDLPYGELVIEEKCEQRDESSDNSDYWRYSFSIVFEMKDTGQKYKIFYVKDRDGEWDFINYDGFLHDKTNNGEAHEVKLITKTIAVDEWVECDE